MSTQSTIYLDYASTTPVDPRVASKMMEFLTPEGEFGNPASRSHRFSWLSSANITSSVEYVIPILSDASILIASSINSWIAWLETLLVASCGLPLWINLALCWKSDCVIGISLTSKITFVTISDFEIEA